MVDRLGAPGTWRATSRRDAAGSVHAELPGVRRGERAAFTLIELLVVIAIIALLLSLLTPALSQARELARKAVCASQLHNIGLGLAQYQNRYGGKVPVPRTTGGLYWFECINEFVDGPDSSGGRYQYFPRTDARNPDWNFDDSSTVTGVWVCPVSQKLPWMGTTYGYSWYPYKRVEGNGYLRWDRFGADTYVISDCDRPNSAKVYLTHYSHPLHGVNSIGQWHLGSANMLRAGLHVDNVHKEDSYYVSRSDQRNFPGPWSADAND